MKNKIINSLASLLVLGVAFSGCEDFLETEPNNQYTEEVVTSNPAIAEGWLLKAYKNLPTNYNFNEDFASDDAVTNDRESNVSSNIISMNLGGWTSSNNPISSWNNAYEANLYLNTFLKHVNDIEWTWVSAEKNDLYVQKMTGEAHGLRAWWNFSLLQAHAGEGTNGELLGFPIVTSVLTSEDDYQVPRASFQDCVDLIIADCDKAIENLPLVWEDQEDEPEYNSVMGARNANRISGMAAMLLKAKVALYAASPAYNPGNDLAAWQRAAEYAADLMNVKGGLSNLSSSDLEFYLDYQSSEIIWASTTNDDSKNWEEENFPPSLFGSGNINPSQNLVDAFPMADGTPINESGSGYDVSNPYQGRDPRLDAYVVYNGSNFSNSTINTNLLSGSDGINGSVNATRTGYYLKKFLNEDVRINPSGTTIGTTHFYTYARYTEALLIFAEAANEAVGPDGVIDGYSARQVINAIRGRVGINSDYVDNNISNQEQMRELIRNERRIEMAFEGQRFWDIRRWEATDIMQEAVKGMEISSDESNYAVITVEKREYAPYQIYGPIPYEETLKYDIIQNQGW
ncbi:RagB/SusD family nutrient uptake outer membrane protein [Thermophagus sp. OGC60D27]|uniref:RagB/SusD family nutrient uptake outer membrane protein n=1 Tax=Thermophagus sp. OGC60D27 TaxID=3458415 RepID=UPI0040376DA0